MDKKRKVLVFFDSAVHFGGSFQSTLLVIKEIQKLREVIVVDAYGICKQYIDAMKRLDIKYIVVQPHAKRPIIAGTTLLDRIWRALLSRRELMDTARRLRTVIETLSPQAIWTSHPKGLFLLSHAVGNRFPLIYYARGEAVYPFWYNRRNWRNISFLIANSQSGLSKIKNSPYERPLMEVVPNGIDVDEMSRIACVKAENLPLGGGLRLCLPGTINENKNQAAAIKGLAEYVNNGGDACLWLAGNTIHDIHDVYAQSLRTLAKNLNITERVHFLGWRNDMPSVIANCDIVVLLSLSEGMPRAILEAMSLQKPIIATRVGGIPEVIRHGIDGILIEPNDSKGFADAIKKLADSVLRRKMGQAGFRRVKSCFDIRFTSSRFLEAVSKIT